MSEPITTGPFHWTKEAADKWTLLKSNISKNYWTSIKGKAKNNCFPDECWAITNKFDPAIVAEQQNSE